MTHNADLVRVERLGATGREEGLYVRFDYGFGTNVHIGFRRFRWPNEGYDDYEKIAMSLGGWRRLCELVDEWRAHDDAPESLGERHQRHYRTCNCLGDKAVCCDLTCPCHTEHFDGLEAVNDEP